MRIKRLEERIEKRKERIEKLQTSLREERNKLNEDENTLLHLKYNDVLKRMQENGLSPDEAMRAIDNGVDKRQAQNNNENESVNNKSEGVRNYENSY